MTTELLTADSQPYNHNLCENIEHFKNTASAVDLGISAVAAWQMWGLSLMESAGCGAPELIKDTRNFITATTTISEQLSRTYKKPEFGLNETMIDGMEVAVAIEKVEGREKAFGSLLHFKRDTDRNDPKVYIVAPTSGHFSTLLRDTVRQLLPSHDVYITDFNDASTIPIEEGDFGLDDYVGHVQEDMRAIGPDCHVLSICQSTVPVLAAVADMAKNNPDQQPALSLTLMAGPLDTAAAETAVTKFADEHDIDWFQHNLIGKVAAKYPGAGRLIYPGASQLGAFIAMNAPKHVDSFKKLFLYRAAGNQVEADKIAAFYTEYQSVSGMTAKFYMDTIRKVFKERQIALGIMRRDNGDLIEPTYITMPLLTIEGGKDDICAEGQTTVAHQLCSGIAAEDKSHFVHPEAGHYSVFSGQKWADEIAPRFANHVRQSAEAKGIIYAAAACKTIKSDRWDSTGR